MRGWPRGRPGLESVHSTTVATLAEQNRCQVGPTILFDRPRQEPPPLASLVSQLGRPFCGRVQSLRNAVPHHLYRAGRNLKGFAPNPVLLHEPLEKRQEK
jgi:hypothetical protein